MVRAAGAGAVLSYGDDGLLQRTWIYSPEPSALARGKRFEEQVVASWRRRNGGTDFFAQHTVALGWHPELARHAGKLPAKAPRSRGSTGRPDMLVNVDPDGTTTGDDLNHDYRALLEVKATVFDGVPLARSKRTIARHREQIVQYIGTQLDLTRPDDFADEEAFVAPGVIYSNTPSDPALKVYVEQYFG